jgi:hypothetical protein
MGQSHCCSLLTLSHFTVSGPLSRIILALFIGFFLSLSPLFNVSLPSFSVFVCIIVCVYFIQFSSFLQYTSLSHSLYPQILNLITSLYFPCLIYPLSQFQFVPVSNVSFYVSVSISFFPPHQCISPHSLFFSFTYEGFVFDFFHLTFDFFLNLSLSVFVFNTLSFSIHFHSRLHFSFV